MQYPYIHIHMIANLPGTVFWKRERNLACREHVFTQNFPRKSSNGYHNLADENHACMRHGDSK